MQNNGLEPLRGEAVGVHTAAWPGLKNGSPGLRAYKIHSEEGSMKKQLSFLAVVMVGLPMVLFNAGAYASEPDHKTHDPGIMERFEHQQKRIDDGVKKGSLTTEEAALVQDNLNRIKADEARLKADGKLTPKEKESLNHKLDLNGQMIKKEKKNAIKHID
jgi:polyhydroxyalkanoate synthesis regulator phasin